MMQIYTDGKFVDLEGLFYSTKDLIFPLDVQDNFLPSLFAVVLHAIITDPLNITARGERTLGRPR